MRILVLIILMSVSFSAMAGESPSSIINYHTVNNDIATSGKPTTEHITALSEQGVKTIIDLRTKSEGIDAEK